jgi:hypothetical protein
VRELPELALHSTAFDYLLSMIAIKLSGGSLALLVLVSLFTSGCATSTVEKRKQERYGAYSALAAEQRELVDQGRVKIGMGMDAVYIALGKPNEVLQQETQAGATTHWLYHGSSLREYRYWTYRGVRVGNRYYSEPYMAQDYYLQPYVRSEIVFQNGVVKEWRTLPSPN